VERFLTHSINR